MLQLLKKGASSELNTSGCLVFRNEEKSKETIPKCTEIMYQIRKSSRSEFTSFDDGVVTKFIEVYIFGILMNEILRLPLSNATDNILFPLYFCHSDDLKFGRFDIYTLHSNFFLLVCRLFSMVVFLLLLYHAYL